MYTLQELAQKARPSSATGSSLQSVAQSDAAHRADVSEGREDICMRMLRRAGVFRS